MSKPRSYRASASRLSIYAAVCLAIVAYFVNLSGEDLSLGDAYEVQAVVPDALGLAPNADVRQAGVVVGKVKETEARAGNTVVLLQLDSKGAPVYRDAQVLMRTKTVVGEPYVELDPGSPKSGQLPSGGLLGKAREAVEIDEVLSTFDRSTRRRLSRLLGDLGQGLDGKGEELNLLLESSEAFVEEGGPVARVLRGERDDVATLVDDFGRVMSALGDRKDDIQLLARRLTVASESLASRDQRVGETLDELPGAIDQVRTTTSNLASFSELATPVLADLRLAFNDLRPAVRDLRPAAGLGRKTVRALGRFAPRAGPLLDELEGFAGAAAGSVGPLDNFLGEYGPFAQYLAPYAPELGSFFAHFRSATDSVRGPGHVARLQVGVSSSSVGAFTPEMKSAFEALLDIGALTEVYDKGENAYPRPGQLGKPLPFEGDYPRVRADD
jgi:phospholipid/cholesterol/gamma-HCH transport system substrate-binding protein